MPLGIPHSVFLGRVVRPGEDPAWEDLDRDKALAFTRAKAELCPGCGTHPDWWDPAKGGHRFAYIGDQRYCPGCEVLDREGKNRREGTEAYVHVSLRPRTPEDDD